MSLKIKILDPTNAPVGYIAELANDKLEFGGCSQCDFCMDNGNCLDTNLDCCPHQRPDNCSVTFKKIN